MLLKTGQSQSAKAVDLVAAICALVAGGATLKAACAAHGVKQHVFQFKVLNHPDLRPRWLAAKRRGLEVSKARGPLRYADEILKLIEAGMSARKACASDSRFPSRHSFVAALRVNPALEHRYIAAVQAREDMHAKCVAAFGEIERRIKAGGRILEVLQPRVSFPDFNVLTRFLRENPEYDARYRAAFRERESGPNAIGQAAKYSDRELRRAAVDLMMNDTRHISTRHVSSTGPHVATLKKAGRRNPELAVAIESAIAMRRARLPGLPGPRFTPTVTLTIPAPKIIRPDPSARLASSLSENDIWRLAVAALPKSLDRDMRDDVASAIVLAVLEGNLSPELIASEAKRFVRNHNNEFSPYRFASLDKQVSFDSTLSFVDTLTTDAWE